MSDEVPRQPGRIAQRFIWRDGSRNAIMSGAVEGPTGPPIVNHRIVSSGTEKACATGCGCTQECRARVRARARSPSHSHTFVSELRMRWNWSNTRLNRMDPIIRRLFTLIRARSTGATRTERPRDGLRRFGGGCVFEPGGWL